MLVDQATFSNRRMPQRAVCAGDVWLVCDTSRANGLVVGCGEFSWRAFSLISFVIFPLSLSTLAIDCRAGVGVYSDVGDCVVFTA